MARLAESAATIIAIDDQPIAATFFNEGRWLTDFITPDALEVRSLYQQITNGIDNQTDRIIACWKWITSQIRYVKAVKGKLSIDSKVSIQNDLWLDPTTTIFIGQGNCAVKSFLLTSLLRNELPANQVYCTLGNLYNGKAGGHAWVKLNLPDGEYYMESTTPTVPPLIPIAAATRYEAVHYFNDKEVLAIPERTQLSPYTACFSTWLSDYLNWAYIEGGRR